jgi:hypothetical protein
MLIKLNGNGAFRNSLILERLALTGFAKRVKKIKLL